MLDFENLSSKDKMFLVCAAIVFFMILFVFMTGFNNKIPNKEIKIDNNQINEKINNLGENYILNISYTTGNVVENYIFYKEDKMMFYEKEGDTSVYLKYNDNMFVIDGPSKEMSKYDGGVSYINNPYYDYELIQEFTKSCDYKFDSLNNVSCKLPLNTYLSYHNSKYGTNYVGEDGTIDIYVTYVNRVNKIKIDYTSFNKYVNQSDEDVIVEIKLKYNTNNFEVIYDNYKEILES